MDDHASLARRVAARFLIAFLATLCLAATVLADPVKQLATLGSQPPDDVPAAVAAQKERHV